MSHKLKGRELFLQPKFVENEIGISYFAGYDVIKGSTSMDNESEVYHVIEAAPTLARIAELEAENDLLKQGLVKTFDGCMDPAWVRDKIKSLESQLAANEQRVKSLEVELKKCKDDSDFDFKEYLKLKANFKSALALSEAKLKKCKKQRDQILYQELEQYEESEMGKYKGYVAKLDAELSAVTVADNKLSGFILDDEKGEL